MRHVLSGNIHPHTGVLQALQCGYPLHYGPSPGAAGHHLLYQRLCRGLRDISAKAPRAPPPLLLLSPQLTKGHLSHFFFHPSVSPTTETTSSRCPDASAGRRSPGPLTSRQWSKEEPAASTVQLPPELLRQRAADPNPAQMLFNSSMNTIGSHKSSPNGNSHNVLESKHYKKAT